MLLKEKKAKVNAQLFARTSVGDGGVRRKCAHGHRVHLSIATSEASVLIDQATRSAKGFDG